MLPNQGQVLWSGAMPPGAECCGNCIDACSEWVSAPPNFACNSPVSVSTFEVRTLESCGFWGVVVCGRQGIACGIDEACCGYSVACPDAVCSVLPIALCVPCVGAPSGLARRVRRACSACRALVLRVPGFLRRRLAFNRLAGCLLGAGVCLDLLGGERALRGTFAAVGALP